MQVKSTDVRAQNEAVIFVAIKTKEKKPRKKGETQKERIESSRSNAITNLTVTEQKRRKENYF